jgi:lysylphosphatidylglycerol synthetase-like protein (DUF2156 family)
MLDKIFSGSVLHTSAHVGFFSGIAVLLPILGDAWQQEIKPWLVSPAGFVIAFALILVSLVVLAFVAGSISKLTKSMGWMILIPGILAIVFAMFGQAEVYAWAGNRITGFAAAEPVIGWLVEHSVPKVTYLGGLYILIGVCLIWVGRRIEAIGQFV